MGLGGNCMGSIIFGYGIPLNVILNEKDFEDVCSNKKDLIEFEYLKENGLEIRSGDVFPITTTVNGETKSAMVEVAKMPSIMDQTESIMGDCIFRARVVQVIMGEAVGVELSRIGRAITEEQRYQIEQAYLKQLEEKRS